MKSWMMTIIDIALKWYAYLELHSILLDYLKKMLQGKTWNSDRSVL